MDDCFLPSIFSEIQVMKISFIKLSKNFNVVKEIKAIHFQESTCVLVLHSLKACFLHLQLWHQNQSQITFAEVSQIRGSLFTSPDFPPFIQLILLKCICYLLVLIYILTQCGSHNLLENMRQLLKQCQFVRKKASGQCIFSMTRADVILRIHLLTKAVGK